MNVSTDLGVSYYYTNQPDRALEQFMHSLKVEPEHVKTILNIGIVRAFGKQDLAGAAEAWVRVIAIAPDSPECRAAAGLRESTLGPRRRRGHDWIVNPRIRRPKFRPSRYRCGLAGFFVFY